MELHELKQIWLFRQHLTDRADKQTVVKDLCGVQAQFMTNVSHSLKIRCIDYDEQNLADGLVKTWSVRGTLHVFSKDDLPLFVCCNDGKDYRSNDWRGERFWNQRECWALTPERQAQFTEVILDAVRHRPQTREELKEICRAAGMTQPEEGSMFDPWGGGLRELCERGFLHYAAQEKKALCLSPEFVPLPQEEAEVEICRRYLTHMAPARLDDLCYYLKCTKGKARSLLSQLPVETMQLAGAEYFYLGRLEGDYPEIPPCLFLAGFDQLMLAYQKERSRFLPAEYLRGIFNLAGIVMPSVLLDGVVCGKWKMTKGKLEVSCFRALTEQERRTVADAAEALWGAALKKLEIK